MFPLACIWAAHYFTGEEEAFERHREDREAGYRPPPDPKAKPEPKRDVFPAAAMRL